MKTLTVRAPAGSFVGIAEDDGGALFAGVPFAEPPVGKARLQPPIPLPDSHLPRETLTFPPAPPQHRAAPPSALNDLGGKGKYQADSSPDAKSPFATLIKALANMSAVEASEDCLYLNVWTPSIGGKRPVLVWLYGGGFEGGSASPPFSNGASLSRLADVVVVAINYRVGVLGFGYWAEIGGPEWSKSSNLGLQDQILGLSWVKRNISAFGGDPENVTVIGESAGAFSIGALLAIDTAKGLFHKAVLQSGSNRRQYSAASGTTITRAVLKEMGCSTVDEFLAAAVDDIINAQKRVTPGDYGDRNLPGGVAWGAVFDGTVICRDLHTAIAEGAAKDIRLVLGANKDEMRIMQVMAGDTYAAGGERQLHREISLVFGGEPAELCAAYSQRLAVDKMPNHIADIRGAFLGDFIYRRPAYEMAAEQVASGGRAWGYLFSAAPFGRFLGSFHALDVIYTFNLLASLGLDTPDNRRVRDEVIGALRKFAHEWEMDWPEYHPERSSNVRNFGEGEALTTEPMRDRVSELWEQYKRV